MPVRARAISLVFSVLAALLLTAAPTPAPVLAGGEKVVVIVGPVGSLTNAYRARGDEVANVATAAGATVVKVYSPNATWANVRAAVDGANIIVYFGHGNGFPNPYGSTELRDRTNGWGLNRTTTNGDGDNWQSTLAYCGEKALMGTLTGSDGVVQQTYCAGGPITPAPGFVMVYGQAHYAPGFGERYVQSTPLTTLAEAQARVSNYSYPVLALGASAYFATAYSDSDDIVSRLLNQPTTPFGDIFRAGVGYSPSTLTAAAHPDVAGAEYWVQRTTISGFHFGEPDYWYAFAGDPARTPSGMQQPLIGPFRDIGSSAFIDDILWLADAGITSGCAFERFCPTASVTREQMASFIARALGLQAATQDYFTDDNGSIHESDINKLAAAGITLGCASGQYCPKQLVYRDQMASFLSRALGLADATHDFFTDDNGSVHEGDINRFAAAGVTNGCAPGMYCPRMPVLREQMAAFLRRALGD
ncbi:MAG: S-layer homology domain-containing protein [Candidatus Limnocylindria bacterium]